jgi:hypothetical protein
MSQMHEMIECNNTEAQSPHSRPGTPRYVACHQLITSRISYKNGTNGFEGREILRGLDGKV